jgi:hypothetical protein
MFVGIVSLMFTFFVNYHVVDTIECLNLFYMHMQNDDEVLRGPRNLGYDFPRPYDVTKALVMKKPKETENYIVDFFLEHQKKQYIFIPYSFKYIFNYTID